MEIKNLLSVASREELREWLIENSLKEECCWVPVSIKPVPHRVQYLDIVEEALCFGWIDSTKKKLADDLTVQRIGPRRKKGNWTELNKERVRRLEKLGMMTEQGRKVLPDMSTASFEIHPIILQALKDHPEAYENYEKFPELYRRIRIDTIQWCLTMKQEENFEKRLSKFIENTVAGKMYGSWNDEGRLLE